MQKNKDNIASKTENTRQSRRMKSADNSCIVIYKDEYYFNPKDKTRIKSLGAKFSNINSFFFDYLGAYNILTGFRQSENNSIVLSQHKRYPFGVRIINSVDKRTARIFSLPVGTPLTIPIIEFHYGNLQDNLISEGTIVALDVCPLEELKIIKRMCSKINAVLRSFFERRNLNLHEVYCYFGKDDDKIFVVDDFTPRSLKVTGEMLDRTGVNPYRLKTPADLKQYVDFMLGAIKS